MRRLSTPSRPVATRRPRKLLVNDRRPLASKSSSTLFDVGQAESCSACGHKSGPEREVLGEDWDELYCGYLPRPVMVARSKKPFCNPHPRMTHGDNLRASSKDHH